MNDNEANKLIARWRADADKLQRHHMDSDDATQQWVLRQCADDLEEVMDKLTEAEKDTARLNWIERTGGTLINDDAGRWACNLASMQPVTSGDTDITQQPIGGAWTFLAEPDDWKPNLRKAIDDLMIIPPYE